MLLVKVNGITLTERVSSRNAIAETYLVKSGVYYIRNKFRQLC